MKKYAVYEKMYASRFIGMFEAESKDEAISKAEKEDEGFGGLCWQCAGQVDVESSGEYDAEEE